ncbi:MAG: hypothetical protein ACM37V_14820 [Gemmatimonadota bacterium]
MNLNAIHHALQPPVTGSLAQPCRMPQRNGSSTGSYIRARPR